MQGAIVSVGAVLVLVSLVADDSVSIAEAVRESLFRLERQSRCSDPRDSKTCDERFAAALEAEASILQAYHPEVLQELAQVLAEMTPAEVAWREFFSTGDLAKFQEADRLEREEQAALAGARKGAGK